MAKVKIHIKDMKQHLGQEIGLSKWMEITQSRVNKFAEATGDFQWVHVDEEQAKADLSSGRTVVHNFLLLSLVPKLFEDILVITGLRYGLNKGAENIQFLTPLPTGSRVRTRLRLSGLKDLGQGEQTATFSIVMEREGSEKLVLKMDLLLLFVAEQAVFKAGPLPDQHQAASFGL
ncbi:MAG: MaoC family dehydratase [Emcibacter sp.]|nr:MaoC family dehydratase [Emcibacter sp.]